MNSCIKCILPRMLQPDRENNSLGSPVRVLVNNAGILGEDIRIKFAKGCVFFEVLEIVLPRCLLKQNDAEKQEGDQNQHERGFSEAKCGGHRAENDQPCYGDSRELPGNVRYFGDKNPSYDR